MHIRFRRGNDDRIEETLKALDRGETPEPYFERVYRDVDHLHRVTRPTNLELLQTLVGHRPASIRETARLVERDVRQVHDNRRNSRNWDSSSSRRVAGRNVRRSGTTRSASNFHSTSPTMGFATKRARDRRRLRRQSPRHLRNEGHRTTPIPDDTPNTCEYEGIRMPVRFDEYEDVDHEFDPALREGSNGHRILSFLADHPTQGFTPKEIHEATDVPMGSVGPTLQRLKDRDLVRHSEPYWAIGEDDRVGAYVGMLDSLQTVDDRYGTESWDEWSEHAVDPREERE